MSVGHGGWVCQTCQTIWPGHGQVGKADQQRFMERAGPGWRRVSCQDTIPCLLFPAFIRAPYIISRPPPGHLGHCLCKKAPQPPAMPPKPNTHFLLTASRQSQGPGPSSWSLFPRPHPSLGTTFPVSTLCTFFSELLRGFSLKTMKRNLQTGGSILSWVCMEGKKRQRGG